uniref:H0525G02.1 protein n=1 Tax=Oryza sativa TaxID=4530 RepID=Q00RR9_ORYSA|nr:H0525G02.1 [Oryza sativa]
MWAPQVIFPLFNSLSPLIYCDGGTGEEGRWRGGAEGRRAEPSRRPRPLRRGVGGGGLLRRGGCSTECVGFDGLWLSGHNDVLAGKTATAVGGEDEIAVNSRLVGSRGPSPSPSTSSRRSSPLRHRPANAVVFDGVLPWAATAAAGLRIPRYAFTEMGCFALSVQRALLLHAPQDGVASDDEPFLVPGLPDVVRLFRPQPPEPCLRRREPLSLRRERGEGRES